METKNLKDTSYWLYTFWNKEEQAKDEYKIFQMLIEDNGFFKANDVKIYNPQLAFILTSKELPVRNMETQIETTINGREYLKTYIEAYKEGEQYFKTESKFAPNTLYETKAKQYVKNQNPTVLNHKTVKEFGYYSGIINKVEEQAKINQLFTPFDKCEHDLPPQQNVTLHNFIFNVTDHDAFLTDLKDTFQVEKGIPFRILIELLKDEKIMMIGENEFAKFHKLIKEYFNRNIGARQGINDNYKHTNEDKKKYKNKIDIITEKLKPLIDKHKTPLIDKHKTP